MKKIMKGKSGINVVTGIKAGGLQTNHNVRPSALSIKSGIRAGEGILHGNHNRNLAKGLNVRTAVKAGGLQTNHNFRLAVLSVKSGIKAGAGILHGNHCRRLA
jgi:hypothetical protein